MSNNDKTKTQTKEEERLQWIENHKKLPKSVQNDLMPLYLKYDDIDKPSDKYLNALNFIRGVNHKLESNIEPKPHLTMEELRKRNILGELIKR